MCPRNKLSQDFAMEPSTIFLLQGIRPEQNAPNFQIQNSQIQRPQNQTTTVSRPSSPESAKITEIIDVEETSNESSVDTNNSNTELSVVTVDPHANFFEDSNVRRDLTLLNSFLNNLQLPSSNAELNGYLMVKAKALFAVVMERLVQNSSADSIDVGPVLKEIIENIAKCELERAELRNVSAEQNLIKQLFDYIVDNSNNFKNYLQNGQMKSKNNMLVTSTSSNIVNYDLPSSSGGGTSGSSPSLPKPAKQKILNYTLAKKPKKTVPVKRLNGEHDKNYSRNIANFCEGLRKTNEQVKNNIENIDVIAETDFPPQLSLQGKIPTKSENTIFQVQSTITIGCSCETSCYKNLEPIHVYSHRLFIERLSRHERSLYLMGIIRCSPFYEDILKRGYTKLSYFSLGRKVCFETFLYLEYCPLSQFNRIRRCIIESGEIPSTIPNGIPSETIPVFVKNFILHILKLTSKYNQNEFFYISKEVTEQSLYEKYSIYIEYADDLGRALTFESFQTILKQQFPNFVFTGIESCKFYEVASMDEFMAKNNLERFPFCKGNGAENICFLDVSKYKMLEKFAWKNVYEDMKDCENESPIFKHVQINI